jgi:hypothetical protein
VCTNTQAHVILVLTVLTMVWAFVYFGLYFFYLSRSVYKLRSLPRQDHKLAHLMVNLQARPFPLQVSEAVFAQGVSESMG